MLDAGDTTRKLASAEISVSYERADTVQVEFVITPLFSGWLWDVG